MRFRRLRPARVASATSYRLFVVALAYVYFEDEPTRRGLVERLSRAEAKRVAQTIARALTAAADREVNGSHVSTRHVQPSSCAPVRSSPKHIFPL